MKNKKFIYLPGNHCVCADFVVAVIVQDGFKGSDYTTQLLPCVFVDYGIQAFSRASISRIRLDCETIEQAHALALKIQEEL